MAYVPLTYLLLQINKDLRLHVHRCWWTTILSDYMRFCGCLRLHEPCRIKYFNNSKGKESWESNHAVYVFTYNNLRSIVVHLSVGSSSTYSGRSGAPQLSEVFLLQFGVLLQFEALMLSEALLRSEVFESCSLVEASFVQLRQLVFDCYRVP
jgi:hypothetical protein